jgi:hypothetical protein
MQQASKQASNGDDDGDIDVELNNLVLNVQPESIYLLAKDSQTLRSSGLMQPQPRPQRTSDPSLYPANKRLGTPVTELKDFQALEPAVCVQL